MKAFEHLTSRRQINRLRGLAQAALHQYGLGETKLVFVACSDNAVFRVETLRGRHTLREPFALRVHRPGYQTNASLAPELAWMAALQRNAG